MIAQNKIRARMYHLAAIQLGATLKGIDKMKQPTFLIWNGLDNFIVCKEKTILSTPEDTFSAFQTDGELTIAEYNALDFNDPRTIYVMPDIRIYFTY